MDKAYEEIIRTKKGKEIIVAVMDSGIDINHEDLKNQIWINNDEIVDNGVDDDGNGYIDDIHGWNFLGNKNGENLVYENWEFIRIIKRYDHHFENINPNSLRADDVENYRIYKKALASLENNKVELEDDRIFLKNFIEKQNAAKIALKKYFPEGNYTRKDLSLIDTNGNETLKKHIKNRKHALYYNMDEDWINYFTEYIRIKDEYKLNLNYKGRTVIGDNPNELSGAYYGNNDTKGNLAIESHATNVAGLITADRNNVVGIKGVANTVKIMPIRVVPQGDEYDKDVAYGIRYAVDNGAKIINMSFGKQFSLNKEYVTEAIKYAAKKDVLLVSAAGNESLNIDINDFYPNDLEPSKPNNEIASNFLVVGASTYKLNKRLLASFSNYGKKNVDIFAPGDDIYIAAPGNKYESDGGTSFAAPIVSGVAALIRSYYPSLSASEVKDILMKSGTAYHINVEVKQEDGTKKSITFSELSKSGRIVNAYNALLLAEQVVKAK